MNILTIWMLQLTFNTLNATTRCADVVKAAFEAAAKQDQKAKVMTSRCGVFPKENSVRKAVIPK